jgi:hypothetical protein
LEIRLIPTKLAFAVLVLIASGLSAQDAAQVHQAPDSDGVYYVGPEIAAPVLVHPILAGYPSNVAEKNVQGMTVPVWIDVRVIFHANLTQAVPQVLITERDLPPPADSQLEDKHHNRLSYTPPFPIHTVDADFTDPFAKHPFVQVAIVTTLVGVDGLPKDVRVSRGLGFGLDEKAKAAVEHYRFLPATKNGKPVQERRDIQVSFAKF